MAIVALKMTFRQKFRHRWKALKIFGSVNSPFPNFFLPLKVNRRNFTGMGVLNKRIIGLRISIFNEKAHNVFKILRNMSVGLLSKLHYI